MTGALAWTIRARITALVAALVMAVGGTLLFANYWWLTRNLPDVQALEVGGEFYVAINGTAPTLVQSDCTNLGTDLGVGVPRAAADATGAPPLPMRSPGAASGAWPADAIPLPPNSDCPAFGPTAIVSGPTGVVGAVGAVGASGPVNPNPNPIRSAIEVTSQTLATGVTEQLGRQSLALLVALTFAAVIAGWVSASRALAPLHAMTERARRLGATSLSERLPSTGPRDEISELGATLNGMLERIEHAVAREHRLVANLAHELRTPLANQRIALEVAIEGHENGADAAPDSMVEAARTALQQNLRTHRLVEQLLMLARIEQAQDEWLEAVDVDLVAAVEGLVAGPALDELGPANVEVAFDPSTAEPVTVRADPLLLDCLIGNLLENAVRHNLPGGKVWVSLPTPPVGMRHELLIENTGPLVPAEVLPSLFQPLRQGPAVHRERQRGRSSIGLGLPLVVAIAKRFGVAIEAQPRAGGGLSVRLRWPASPGDQRATRAPDEPGLLHTGL